MVLNLGIGESCAYQRRAEWIGTPVCNVRMKTATKLISEATSLSGQERRTGPGTRRSSNSAFRWCEDRRRPGSLDRRISTSHW